MGLDVTVLGAEHNLCCRCAAVGSVARTPIGYVLMWTMGYGLNGFAYGSAFGYGLSCVLILYIVFYKQGAHRPYWHGWVSFPRQAYYRPALATCSI